MTSNVCSPSTMSKQSEDTYVWIAQGIRTDMRGCRPGSTYHLEHLCKDAAMQWILHRMTGFRVVDEWLNDLMHTTDYTNIVYHKDSAGIYYGSFYTSIIGCCHADYANLHIIIHQSDTSIQYTVCAHNIFMFRVDRVTKKQEIDIASDGKIIKCIKR